MAWTATHIGTVATANANSITPGCTSTTAGTTLIAALTAQSGAAVTWTLPAGWVKGAQEQASNDVNAAVYYYLNNPGSITSVACGASVTNNLTALIAEFTPAAGVFLNATGVNSAGSAATLTVTTSTNATAGDLGICCFGAYLSPSTAATWTQPASWTTMGDTVANTNVHAYSAYILSAAGGAALAVQGQVNVTQTQFAGACCTFSLVPATSPAGAITLTATSTGTPVFSHTAKGFPAIIPVLEAADLI